MNIAMEQTEEYVNGQLKAKYGDAFIRGNNGASSRRVRAADHRGARVLPRPSRDARAQPNACAPLRAPPLSVVMYISTQKKRSA